MLVYVYRLSLYVYRNILRNIVHDTYSISIIYIYICVCVIVYVYNIGFINPVLLLHIMYLYILLSLTACFWCRGVRHRMCLLIVGNVRGLYHCTSMCPNLSWLFVFQPLFDTANSQHQNIPCVENHHVQWENSLFQWPFSIAILNYQNTPTNTTAYLHS